MYAFETVVAFRAAFPDAKRYQKANDPRFPCLAIPLKNSVFVKKNWGPGVIDVEAPPETHVLLVNCATGDTYPCAVDKSGWPVGYQPSDKQPSSYVVAYDSEPIWASEPVAAPVMISTIEGEHEVPVGARLAFSQTKNLYHIAADKWERMGYAPLQ